METLLKCQPPASFNLTSIWYGLVSYVSSTSSLVYFIEVEITTTSIVQSVTEYEWYSFTNYVFIFTNESLTVYIILQLYNLL